MKKNIIFFNFLFSVMFAFVLSSCKSTKIEPAAYSPTGVVSIYGNSSLPWFDSTNDKKSDTDTKSGGMLTGLLNRSLNENDPEIQTVNSRIDSAADTFNKMIEEKLGMQVVDHSKIQQSQMYKANGVSFFANASDNVPAEGYKAMESAGSKFNKTVAKQTGVKSLIYVSFIFYKEKQYSDLVNQIVKARTRMTVKIVDENGKTIWNKQYSATSMNSVAFKNGKWDKEELCKCYPEVVESAINQFISDFTKDSSKENDVVVKDSQKVPVEENAESVISNVEATPIAIPDSVKNNDTEKESQIIDDNVENEAEVEVTQ